MAVRHKCCLVFVCGPTLKSGPFRGLSFIFSVLVISLFPWFHKACVCADTKMRITAMKLNDSHY